MDLGVVVVIVFLSVVLFGFFFVHDILISIMGISPYPSFKKHDFASWKTRI